jgi:transcriptional regulator with XRE-family HTH domain
MLLRLGELRRLKGVSQAEMAKALHVNQTAISQWERNVYYPSCDKLPEIAQLLGCTIDELFEEAG